MATGAMLQARPLQKVAFPTAPLGLARRGCVAKLTAGSRTECSTAPESKEVVKTAALSATVSTLFAGGSVQAAQEVASVADADYRLGGVLFVIVPAIGWVLYNILGPAQSQLEAMNRGKPRSKVPPKKVKTAFKRPVPKKVVLKKPPPKIKTRAAAVGLGLAAIVAAQSADAATIMGQIGDAGGLRGGAVLLAVLPALGWVLYNIADPATKQYEAMKK